MRRWRTRSAIGARALAIVAAVAMVPFVGSGTASADPVTSSGHLLQTVKSADGSYVQNVTVKDPQHLIITVYSAAMHQAYPVQVQRPHDTSTPRPVLYLLNGAGGGVDEAQWQLNTDVMQFLATKDVNVVMPVGGPWSYYTDWRAPDPVLGVNKWKTFLTEEVPPIVNAGLGTSGLNSIAGISTSGTTVLALPEAKPGLYKSVGAYSGCAQISDPVGYNFVKTTVDVWGGGNVDNMYGPENDPMWRANDPYVHADKLRGLAMFISAGSGIPGKWDTLNGPHTLPGVGGLINQVTVGGVIEAAVDYCTHNLQNKLNSLAIPATYDFPPTGTHSWGYWQDEFHRSWPVLAAPLGIS